MADMRIENHGTIALIMARSDEGRDWLADNIHAEAWQYFGSNIAAEPRSIEAVIAGAESAGLAVEVAGGCHG